MKLLLLLLSFLLVSRNASAVCNGDRDVEVCLGANSPSNLADADDYEVVVVRALHVLVVACFLSRHVGGVFFFSFLFFPTERFGVYPPSTLQQRESIGPRTHAITFTHLRTHVDASGFIFLFLFTCVAGRRFQHCQRTSERNCWRRSQFRWWIVSLL